MDGHAVQRQTYGYLPSHCVASLLRDWYQIIMCVYVVYGSVVQQVVQQQIGNKSNEWS